MLIVENDMAYESGYRFLDGRPCQPILTNYFVIVIFCFLICALFNTLFAPLFFEVDVENKVFTKVGYKNWITSILITTFILSMIFIIDEYKERKKVFKKYYHELDVYHRRQSMIVNNGGKLKTDKELYLNCFK
jgi:hypothetical protein